MTLGQVFKINDKSSPHYLMHHFQKPNKIEGRPETRGKANNFDLLRLSTDTFVFTAIKDWNDFPSSIKDLKVEKKIKRRSKGTPCKISNKEEK